LRCCRPDRSAPPRPGAQRSSPLRPFSARPGIELVCDPDAHGGVAGCASPRPRCSA
jgi:hypothetical protein